MGLQILGSSVRTPAKPTQAVNLVSGQVYNIPSGQYMVIPGLYTFLQWWDPVLAAWRNYESNGQQSSFPLSSDGFNYRLANLTGGMVGAVVTNGGSGYTNGIYYPVSNPNPPNNPNAVVQAGTAAAPSVTMSAGGGSILATCNIVVGGAINTTITITTAGSGYTRAPILTIDPPPAGGVQATAYATISAGAIATVVVTNQGAGYATAPLVTVTNGQGDTAGSGGVLTVNATLALSGQVVCLTMVNNGAGMTSVPTFTFTPASTTAATAIMCFTITTGVNQATTQLGTGNIGFAIGGLTAGTSTSTNPAITTGMFVPRPGYTALNTTASGGITFLDGGLHQIIPTAIAYASLSTGTVPTVGTPAAQTVGGVASDISYLLPL